MGIDPSRRFIPVNIAVLTVSDTRSLANDTSGDTLVARIQAAGHAVAERALERDETDTIERRLREVDRQPGHRRGDHHRRHRHHRSRCHARGVSSA